MIIYTFHTPELVPPLASAGESSGSAISSPDCTIVVDVLRATTTIATALAAGADGVQVFSDLDELQRTGSAWPAGARLLAGERGGQAVAGFDLGNSPLDYTRERVAGKRIFMSTTNGTRALQRVQSVPVVITAALVNVGIVVEFLQQHSFETLWIVGSGWQGAYALEDAVCGGAITDALQTAGFIIQPGNDETIGAVALYRQWQDDLVGLLRQASHGKRLLALGSQYDQDLMYCANLNSVSVLPRQKEPGLLVA